MSDRPDRHGAPDGSEDPDHPAHSDGSEVPAGAEIPDVAAARDHVRAELVRFARALRRAGATVPANAATTAARALVEVGFADRARARAALRAALVADSDDLATFDRLFVEFWRRLTAGLDGDGPASRSDANDAPDGGLAPLGDPDAVAEGSTDADEGERGDEDGGGPEDRAPDPSTADGFGAVVADAGADGPGDGDGPETALYSPTGDPAAVTPAPLVGAGDLAPAFRGLTDALAGLRGRRWEPGGDRADVRRALRASVATGGAVLSVPGRKRRRSAVRALLLVDVSRSVLDTVDRGFLIDFLRRARRDWRDARVFFFDEDLREVTDAVDASSARAALEALEAAEAAWGGGTRIGGSLARLRETAPEAVDRRTVVFVVSDGLETGDVSTLEGGVAWLARRGRRLFWLNPLAAAPEYEPAARGMAAALPYLDGLFAFAGPADVAEMARQLRRQGPGGRIGHEFDARGDDRRGRP